MEHWEGSLETTEVCLWRAIRGRPQLEVRTEFGFTHSYSLEREKTVVSQCNTNKPANTWAIRNTHTSHLLIPFLGIFRACYGGVAPRKVTKNGRSSEKKIKIQNAKNGLCAMFITNCFPLVMFNKAQLFLSQGFTTSRMASWPPMSSVSMAIVWVLCTTYGKEDLRSKQSGVRGIKIGFGVPPFFWRKMLWKPSNAHQPQSATEMTVNEEE